MYSQFYMRHADPKKIQDFSDYFYAETENNTEFKVKNLFLEEIKSSLIQYEWELGIFYGETYSDKKLTKTAYKIIVFIDDFLENYNNPDNENSIDINIYHALLYVKQILESSLNKSWGYKFFHARSHLSDIKYKNILDNILSVLPDDIEKTIFNLNQSDGVIPVNMLHTYACDGDWLLSNFSQTVLTVAELIARLKSAKYYVNYDFIYIIDANGKLRFSPSIDSLHKQISGAKKVCGAGEIYFHKNIHGIEVNLINNKSGAYLPGDEFLIPMQEFFGALGFITSETQLLDERANLIENRVKLTGNFRNNLAF